MTEFALIQEREIALDRIIESLLVACLSTMPTIPFLKPFKPIQRSIAVAVSKVSLTSLSGDLHLARLLAGSKQIRSQASSMGLLDDSVLDSRITQMRLHLLTKRNLERIQCWEKGLHQTARR